MAVRNAAMIFTDLWSEDLDFRALPAAAQRTYFVLVSQPNLNFAGIMPMTRARWASYAPDITVADVDADLAVLHDRRFVVADHDTEDVLVRSLIRRDGVWKQPKMLNIALKETLSCASWRIRAAVLQELSRLDPGELPQEPRRRRDGAVLPSIGEDVAQMLAVAFERLQRTLPLAAYAVDKPVDSTVDNPSEPVDDVSFDDLVRLAGTSKEGLTEGPRQGPTQGPTEGPTSNSQAAHGFGFGPQQTRGVATSTEGPRQGPTQGGRQGVVRAGARESLTPDPWPLTPHHTTARAATSTTGPAPVTPRDVAWRGRCAEPTS